MDINEDPSILESSEPYSPGIPKRGVMFAANELDKDAVVDIRKHYDSIRNTDLSERQNSPIIHVKNFNNWIKAVLIRTYAFPGCKVFDMACGKGGDLLKWGKANVSKYIGVDISPASIEDAMNRYKGRTSDKQYEMNFEADFMCFDCCKPFPEKTFRMDLDIVSCQFALHYAFQSEERARCFIMNASRCLKNGGIFVCTIPDEDVIRQNLFEAMSMNKTSFGNGLYEINFEVGCDKINVLQKFGFRYTFSLNDAIYECPEYVVCTKTLIDIASENNMELIETKPFKVVYKENKVKHKDLINKMKLHRIPYQQMEVSNLYKTVVFRKKHLGV